MKFSKLLVLSALWLSANGAMAEVPTGVWTIPEPQGLEFTEFVEEGHAYLYNPASKLFFYSGNEWNTRATLAATGFEMWFQASTEADAPEGSYEFWDVFTNPDRGDVSGNHNLFTDDGGATWVDHAQQGNYSWSVTKEGDSYRFQNVALVADVPSYEGKYIGWKGDYNDLRLYMITAEEGSIDWKFVTTESFENFLFSEGYEAYKAGVAAYLAALSLEATLNEAEGLNITITDYLAVYTNKESTADELKAANTALAAIITAKNALKALLDEAPEVGAVVADQQAVFDNPAATADELNAAANAIKPVIDARKELKAKLDEAKEKGFTETAAAEAVYANTAATAEEVKKALEDLNAAMIEWGKGHATVQNPADMSSMIKNPNFDNASNANWEGTKPNMTGSGAHGPANVAEVWNATFDTYQDINGLPAGVYSLGAQTMWRCHWVDMVNNIGPAAKLYVVVGENESSVPFNYAFAPMITEAVDGSNTSWGVAAGFTTDTDEETGTTYYIPNDPSAFRIYAEQGYYDTKVLFGVKSDQVVRIGVKNPQMMGTWDNWSCFDTFTLTYYGEGSDAAKLYLDETIKNYSEMTIEEGTVYTASYLTAYNEALKQDISVNSFDEVATAMGGIEEAKAAIDKNIKLWQEWQELCETLYNKYAVSSEYEQCETVGFLSDYCEMDDDGEGGPGKETILSEKKLTNEELEAEIARLKAWEEAILEEAKTVVKEGDDVTRFIKNPTFETKTTANTGTKEGWTVDRIDGGNVTPGPINADGDTFLEKCGYYNGCFESWHCHKWDVWQEIEDLPKGMYELNVQGYVRCEVTGYQRGNDLTDFPSPVYLYMNSATAQFPNVYSQVPADYGIDFQIVESWTTEDINGNLFPNSMGGAAQCFNNPELYKMTAYGLIAKKGDKFRIGVRMDADQDWWCIWDNFKLTYREPTAEVVQPILEAELEKIDLSQAMGSDIYAQASKVKEEAAAAIAAADGDKMFDALVAVYNLEEAINASVAQFQDLTIAVGELRDAISNAVSVEATKSEARTLATTIETGIEDHVFEGAQVEGLVADIYKIVNKLGIPAGYENATDDNSYDFTGVIRNASYDEGLKGWSGTAAAWSSDGTDAEIFGKNFDYYQDIYGMPAGTYQLSVQAFYRAGAAADDYSSWLENPEANNNAFLYASYCTENDTTTSSKPLVRLAAEAGATYVGSDGYVTLKEATEEEEGLAVCNSMTTASYEFMEEKYQNSIIVKVGEGGTLRIGLKKQVDLTDNWTIWDNWKLTYFGTNSVKEADNDLLGINSLSTSDAAKIEYFNLNGSRISGLKRGVVLMKQTMSDGSVKVRKVAIK